MRRVLLVLFSNMLAVDVGCVDVEGVGVDDAGAGVDAGTGSNDVLDTFSGILIAAGLSAAVVVVFWRLAVFEAMFNDRFMLLILLFTHVNYFYTYMWKFIILWN